MVLRLLAYRQHGLDAALLERLSHQAKADWPGLSMDTIVAELQQLEAAGLPPRLAAIFWFTCGSEAACDRRPRGVWQQMVEAGVPLEQLEQLPQQFGSSRADSHRISCAMSALPAIRAELGSWPAAVQAALDGTSGTAWDLRHYLRGYARDASNFGWPLPRASGSNQLTPLALLPGSADAAAEAAAASRALENLPSISGLLGRQWRQAYQQLAASGLSRQQRLQLLTLAKPRRKSPGLERPFAGGALAGAG